MPKIQVLRSVLFCAVAILISACVTPAVLSNRAIDFNEAVARASDSQLLLNIVRAAYRNPTHYTAVTQVREVRSLEGSAQVAAQFPFGVRVAGPNSLTPLAGMRATQQPSFDITPLDNRTAALGLFRPVDPQAFVTYWQQGWPRAVLLFMFVDEISLNNAARIACGLDRNFIDNAAFNYAQFSRAKKFFDCISRAVRIVERSKTKEFMRNTAVSPEMVLHKLPDLQKEKFSVSEKTDGSGRKVYSVSKTEVRWSVELNLRGRRTMGFLSRERTGVTGPNEQPAVSFTMRSVEGMIYYLGELVRLQLDGYPPPRVAVGNDQAILFQAELDGASSSDDSIEVEYLGRRFAVRRTPPQDSDDRTLTVLSLLSQLFALYREDKDLPRTQAVQVVAGP